MTPTMYAKLAESSTTTADDQAELKSFSYLVWGSGAGIALAAAGYMWWSLSKIESSVVGVAASKHSLVRDAIEIVKLQ